MKNVFYTVLALAGFALLVITFRACSIVDKVVEPDNIFYSQEEFETLYEQHKAICAKIQALEFAEDESGGFSKNERLIGLKQSLAETAADYNSKSRSVRRSFWKSNSLPETLNNICK